MDMRSIATLAGTLLALTLSTAAAPAATHTLAPRSYKPTRNWCPTNRTCFQTIRWSTYSASRAIGRGRAKECAGGGGPCRVHASVKAALFEPRFVCGALRFTRLRMFGRTFLLDDFCQPYQG
jgi:hypothetical protein